MPHNHSSPKKKPSYLKIVVRAYASLFAVTAGMFALAGRITYWQGWVFAGVLLGVTAVASVLFRQKKDLIQERAKPGPGAKWWDKVFYALYIPAGLGVYGVACLDGGRFRWTGELPAAFYLVSYGVLALSYAGAFWAMWANKFFSRVVRIQTERGHYVVQDGPYRFVRHPGYLAGSFTLPGMALVLGSVWALIPAGLCIILLIVRTYLEDATLKKELPGYADYAKKVRFRLLPGLW